MVLVDGVHHGRGQRRDDGRHPEAKGGRGGEDCQPIAAGSPGKANSAKPTAAIKGPTVSGNRTP